MHMCYKHAASRASSAYAVSISLCCFHQPMLFSSVYAVCLHHPRCSASQALMQALKASRNLQLHVIMHEQLIHLTVSTNSMWPIKHHLCMPIASQTVCGAWQASHDMVINHAAQITDLFNLVLGYGFEIPALDMAAYKTMPSDISTILQTMDLLEASQEEQTQRFAKELAEGLFHTQPPRP